MLRLIVQLDFVCSFLLKLYFTQYSWQSHYAVLVLEIGAGKFVPKPLNRNVKDERNSDLQRIEIMKSEEGVKSLAKKLAVFYF